MIWEITLPDGSRLTDPQHADLLDWLRRFVWSLHVEPASGHPLAPASMAPISTGIATLVAWMVENGYRMPAELTPEAMTAFRQDLPSLLASDEDDEGEVSHGAVISRLRLPRLLWEQRDILAKAGVAPMPDDPFDDRTIGDLAGEITSDARGWTKPLQDEVAIPILNRAVWFLGVPADDILSLQGECLAAYDLGAADQRSGADAARTRGKRRQGKAARDFFFSAPAGEEGPWHEPLASWDGRVTILQRVRQLVLALRAAAVITIQATGGMRISEVCGLPAGTDPETGLPNCVRVERSATGLNELFIVRTALSKTEETPRDVDWVIGMRPRGSVETPPAVRALQVLDRLLAPYRVLIGSDRLLVSLAGTHGLPKNAVGVGVMTCTALRESIRDWVAGWVDLSGLPDESAHKVEDNDLVPWRESRGRIIRTHQFRKMWANFALSVDPRLLPVVQMQFHHISLAMTEGGYWGNNRLQVEALSSAASQQTNLAMYEAATGKSLVAGRMGEQIDQHLGELRRRIAGKPTSEAWRETVRFVNDFDLRLWFSPHGKCLPLVPTAMRCHEAGGTSHWLNREPNYETREPTICAGCPSFVLDGRHRGFWEERYIENQSSYRRAERMGMAESFRVVRERAAQARILLTRIGADVASLDRRINETMEDGDDA